MIFPPSFVHSSFEPTSFVVFTPFFITEHSSLSAASVTLALARKPSNDRTASNPFDNRDMLHLLKRRRPERSRRTYPSAFVRHPLCQRSADPPNKLLSSFGAIDTGFTIQVAYEKKFFWA
jgi:hypothetical protein